MITFIDITVSFVFRVSTVGNSVANIGQRNTGGVSAEKMSGQITGEIRTVSLVRTIRTVLGAITELVWRNTVRCGALPHVGAALSEGGTVPLVTPVTAVRVPVTQPGRLSAALAVLALELLSLARL